MYSNFNRSTRVRFILLSLLIVVVGLVVLAATPTVAKAAYVNHFQVHCKPDRLEVKIDARGDYTGQTGYIRFHTWAWVGNSWHYLAPSEWQEHYLEGPGNGWMSGPTSAGSTMTLPGNFDTYIHMKMDLATWNGSSWDIQRFTAAHYQWPGQVAGNYCLN